MRRDCKDSRMRLKLWGLTEEERFLGLSGRGGLWAGSASLGQGDNRAFEEVWLKKA